jgi:hypothetical protein
MALKWTHDALAAEAKKYDTREEFREYSNSAYITACRRGLVDLICEHMSTNRIRWTDEMIGLAAAQFQSRADFRVGSPAAYSAASHRDLMDRVCGHMKKRECVSWTDEMLAVEAARYSSRWEFNQGSQAAYQAAWRRSILDLICAHMPTAPNTTVQEPKLADTIYVTSEDKIDTSPKVDSVALHRDLLGNIEPNTVVLLTQQQYENGPWEARIYDAADAAIVFLRSDDKDGIYTSLNSLWWDVSHNASDVLSNLYDASISALVETSLTDLDILLQQARSIADSEGWSIANTDFYDQ